MEFLPNPIGIHVGPRKGGGLLANQRQAAKCRTLELFPSPLR